MPKANLGKQNGERYLGVKEFTFPHHDLVTVYLQKNVESCGDQIIAIISVANFIILRSSVIHLTKMHDTR